MLVQEEENVQGNYSTQILCAVRDKVLSQLTPELFCSAGHIPGTRQHSGHPHTPIMLRSVS